MAKLQHKLMALHLHCATPSRQKKTSITRLILEAVLVAAFMGVLLVTLIVVGDV